MSKNYLVVVDVQKDFVDGSLAVKGAKEVIPTINGFIEGCNHLGIPIIYTIDYHKPNHPSFEAYDGPWPPHCVVGTPGSQFDDTLKVVDNATIVPKGYNEEAYSADLVRYVQPGAICVVVGIATDYCVKETCKHLIEDCKAAKVIVAADGTASVGDKGKALDELRSFGVEVKTSEFA